MIYYIKLCVQERNEKCFFELWVSSLWGKTHTTFLSHNVKIPEMNLFYCVTYRITCAALLFSGISTIIPYHRVSPQTV